ncbi:hypothetical protein E4T39_01262 [Aureobasidium subglaciale]|nr:hypothetical protein E4T39_01262 [Aureobasidium subglaciale]
MDQEKMRGFLGWMRNNSSKAQNMQNHTPQEAAQESTPRTFYPNTTPSNVYSPSPSTYQQAQPSPPGLESSVVGQVPDKRTMIFNPNGNISCNVLSAPQLKRPTSQITHQPLPQKQQQSQQLDSSLTPQASSFAPRLAAQLRNVSRLAQLLEPIQQHQQSQQDSSHQHYQPPQQQLQPPQQYQQRQLDQPDLDHLLRSRATSPQQSISQINPVQSRAGRSQNEARYQPYSKSRAGNSQGSLLFSPQNKPQAGLQNYRTASHPRPRVSAQSGPTAMPHAPQSTDPTTLSTSQNLLQSQVGHGLFQPQHRVVPQPLSSNGLPPALLRSHNPVQARVRHTSQGISPTSSDTLPGSSPSSFQDSASPHAAQHQFNDASQVTVFNPQGSLSAVTKAPLLNYAQPGTVSQALSTAQALLPPPPHSVWLPELHAVTYVSLPLQAARYDETKHANQKKLVELVYDILFMQALFFHRDQVLLVTSKELETPCWELPQSVWHAYDLSTLPANAPIYHHVRKALNQVTDLHPSELVSSAGCERHDSAVDLVKTDGELTHGWAIACAFEVKPGCLRASLHSHCTDLAIGFFREQQVGQLNMDPVWKAKLLEIFKLRREAGKTI